MQKCGFARVRSAVAYINVREAVDGERNAFWRHFTQVFGLKRHFELKQVYAEWSDFTALFGGRR